MQGIIRLSLITAVLFNFAACVSSGSKKAVSSKGALKNSTELTAIFKKIGADRISAVQGVQEIKKVSNIIHDETVGSVSVYTRADMFPFNGSKGVYSLPSMFVFPQTPAAEPMTMTHRTAKVRPAKHAKVMANAGVKAAIAKLSTGMKSIVNYDKVNQQLVVESEVMVNNLDAVAMETFVRAYIKNMANLSRNLEKAGR